MALEEYMVDLPWEEALQSVLQATTDPVILLLILVGTVIGVVTGVIPGIGGLTALAVLIPFTFTLDPMAAVMFIAAILGGGNQGGSVSAILLNIPGRAPNAASILDGYPMTRQGEGERALGIAATASGLGAVFGLAILVLSLPFLAAIALLFSPPDIFWLGLWGLATIAIVVRGNVLAGVISAGLGLMLSFPGYSQITGGTRWVFDVAALLDGFRLVPAIIGLFAIGEMINLVSKGEKIAGADSTMGGSVWRGVRDVVHHKWVFLKSATVGLVIGIIPGVGGTAANFIAYFQAARSSGESEAFGTGDVRGLIASEASNDAKDGGGYIPTFGFGIPGSPAMVLFLGLLVIQGIPPGPFLLVDHFDIVLGTIVAALISNMLSSVLVLGFGSTLAKITTVEPPLLASVIIPVTFVSSYLLNGSFWDVYVTLLFGVLGFMMLRVRMSRVPLLLGMVLGPIVEDNFLRSIALGQGDLSIFIESPISKILVVIVVLTVLTELFDLRLSRFVTRG
ncbi:tripartite tricarboxylate transporter permease [Halobacteriales archaeon Cl-PHB]